MVQNDSQHVKIRRCQNTLSVVGTGIILFAAWSLVKAFGTLLVMQNDSGQLTITELRQNAEALTDAQFYLLLFAITLLSLSVEIIIRLYTGLSAMSEARGSKRSPVYIVLTGVLMLESITTLMLAIISLFTEEVENPGQPLTTVIIEITSLIMMGEMIVSAIQVRKLTGSGEHSIHLKE